MTISLASQRRAESDGTDEEDRQGAGSQASRQTKGAGSQASRQTNRWTDTINVQSSEAQRTGQTEGRDRVLAGRQAGK